MTNPKTAETLDGLARQIEEHDQKSDEHLVKAAALVAEARRRVEAGEAGDTTWYSWGSKHIHLSPSRLRDLQRIAQAKDPAKELARQRKQTCERAEKHREKMAKAERKREKERQALISWAKTAPINEVRQVLGQIEKRRGTALSEPPEGRRKHLEAA